MENLSAQTVEFTNDVLQLVKEKYNYVVCTPINMESSAVSESEDLVVLLTPVKEIIDGFNSLNNLNKESFLLTMDEIEEEITNTKEPYLNFTISKEIYNSLSE